MQKAIMIKGTHCPACKTLIEDVSGEVKGIISCNVDYKTGKTEIECDNASILKDFKKKVEELGDYRVMS